MGDLGVDRQSSSRTVTIASSFCTCLFGTVFGLLAVSLVVEPDARPKSLQTDRDQHERLEIAPSIAGKTASRPHFARAKMPSQSRPELRPTDDLSLPASSNSNLISGSSSLRHFDRDELDEVHAPPDRVDQPWTAQVSASWSHTKAQSQYSELRRKFPDIFAGNHPLIVQLRTHSMGFAIRYVVRIGQANKASADKFCERLIEAGGACVVYRSSKHLAPPWS